MFGIIMNSSGALQWRLHRWPREWVVFPPHNGGYNAIETIFTGEHLALTKM